MSSVSDPGLRMSFHGLLIFALSLTPVTLQDRTNIPTSGQLFNQMTTENTSETNFSDVNNNFTIYYDMDWKVIPASSSNIKDNRFSFGPIPCSCQDSICGCCVNVNMNFFNFSRTGCMNFTYVPNDFAVQMSLLMNDESVYNNSLSGKNPPPACVPIPYVPGAEMCIRLFDIYTEGRNIHMCVNLETTIIRQPIMVLQFDCFTMGSDGVSHSKPTESPARVEEAVT